MQDPTSVFSNNSRQIGIRVKLLAPNSVKFETLVQEGIEGTVTKLPYREESSGKKITVSSDSLFPAFWLLLVCIIRMYKWSLADIRSTEN